MHLAVSTPYSPALSLAPILARRAEIAREMEGLVDPSDAVLEEMTGAMIEAGELALEAPVTTRIDVAAALDYVRGYMVENAGDELGQAMVERIAQFIGIRAS